MSKLTWGVSRFLSMALVLALCVSFFTGCEKQPSGQDMTPPTNPNEPETETLSEEEYITVSSSFATQLFAQANTFLALITTEEAVTSEGWAEMVAQVITTGKAYSDSIKNLAAPEACGDIDEDLKGAASDYSIGFDAMLEAMQDNSDSKIAMALEYFQTGNEKISSGLTLINERYPELLEQLQQQQEQQNDGEADGSESEPPKE